MNRIIKTTIFTLAIVIGVASALAQSAQSTLGAQLAELNNLKDKVKNPDTRTRVDAFHQVWTIALASENTDVKILALDLMAEPVASASDHIRMPAVYAIAEVANSTSDGQVQSFGDVKGTYSCGTIAHPFGRDRCGEQHHALGKFRLVGIGGSTTAWRAGAQWQQRYPDTGNQCCGPYCPRVE